MKWITSYNCGVVLIILIAVIAVIIGLDHAQDNFGWVQSNLVGKRCFSSILGESACVQHIYRRFHWPSENGYGNELFQNWYFTPFDTFPLPSSCLNVYLWGINFPQHDFFNV